MINNEKFGKNMFSWTERNMFQKTEKNKVVHFTVNSKLYYLMVTLKLKTKSLKT